MEILVPGHRNDSAELRKRMLRDKFGYLPAWRVQALDGRTFYICGKCFKNRGNGPATSVSEFWTAGAPPVPDNASFSPGQRIPERVVPPDARCEDCGHPAWPTD